MNLLASFEPNRGSGLSCSLLAVNLRAMRLRPEIGRRGSRSIRVRGDGGFRLLLLLALGRRGALGRGPVLGPGLLAVGHAEAVEDAPDDVVADAREVADPAAADQDDRVFLEVVALAADVGGHFLAVGEPDPRHLAERRVRLLRGHRLDLEAD